MFDYICFWKITRLATFKSINEYYFFQRREQNFDI